MDLTPGSIIAGKFRLERPLAQGGMGSVWVAHNEQLDVPVAIKFMATSLVGSSDLVARFEREAKAAAQLRHPNVVQILEHGVHDEQPFIAMELLEGESLSQRLRRYGRLTPSDTSRILGEVCLALRRAQERGLVHRDLKPANIYLCRHDELEIVKVLDFGIAKSMTPASPEDITKSGAVFGSPHYMSPEQARRTATPVDHRSDLWAVGVIAFRCLTGQLPFPGDDTIDVLVRVCTEPPPRPSALFAALGPEADRFFEQALARDPEARFQNARDLAEGLAALASALAGREGFELPPASARGIVGPPPPMIVVGPLPPAPEAAPLPQRPPDVPVLYDPSDMTATLPLEDQAVQRAIAGTPWAQAGSASPQARSASPSNSEATPAPFSAATPVPEPLSVLERPTQPGTLTSAGTELSLHPVVLRPRSRLAPFAALAVMVSIGVAVIAVVIAGGSGPESGATPGDSAPAPSVAMTASEGPGATTAVVPTASATVAAAASAPDAAPSATATATATATAKGTFRGGKGGTPGKGSGFLGKPKF